MGMNLHDYLKNRDETDAEFARRARISRATFFRLKRGGKERPSSKTIARVVKACEGQVSADELLGIAPKPRRKERKRSAA